MHLTLLTAVSWVEHVSKDGVYVLVLKITQLQQHAAGCRQRFKPAWNKKVNNFGQPLPPTIHNRGKSSASSRAQRSQWYLSYLILTMQRTGAQGNFLGWLGGQSVLIQSQRLSLRWPCISMHAQTGKLTYTSEACISMHAETGKHTYR